jgi:hypothetical protein
LPPLAANFLSSDSGAQPSRKRLTFSSTRGGLTALLLERLEHSHLSELRWRADPGRRSPHARRKPGSMLAPPRNLIDVSYLDVNDAAHRAVAKLLSLEPLEATPRNKLAILVTSRPAG